MTQKDFSVRAESSLFLSGKGINVTVFRAAFAGLLAFSVLFLASCTTAGGGRMGLFTASAPVVAIMYDDLFLGEAIGHVDRTGTIDMHSAIDSEKRCVGEFRYTGSNSGIANLQCNDGAAAHISFNALSMLSGYGYGSTARGPVSFTYGLTLDEAAKYLTLPGGKKLVQKPSGPALVQM
jgi:hypothetical protein